ncbi:MAG: hypothetical protein Q8K12_03940 [Thiobacillus sp.]|nr:hypothetical protein [Thiobacillus sp.]
MTRRKFIAALFCSLAATCLPGVGAAWAGGMRKIVLVVASGSDINRLSPGDTRKLFLGVPVAAVPSREPLHPLRNASDPVLEEAFLQKVIFMSRDAYERALLTRAMRGGGSRPARFDSETALVNALLADRFAVTYMWADRAAAWPNIKIVAELWQEN